MKKVIRLTENDLTKIVKRVLKEEQETEVAAKMIKSKTSSCWSGKKYPLLNKLMEATAASPFCVTFAVASLIVQPVSFVNHATGKVDFGKAYFDRTGSNSENETKMIKSLVNSPSILGTLFCGMTAIKVEEAIKKGLLDKGKLWEEIKSYGKCVTGF